MMSLISRRGLFHIAVAVCLLFPAGSVRAQEKKLPRVLILGDSISLGYTSQVRELLKDTAEVSRPKENCQHSAHGVANIKRWLGDGKWDVIHFNFGIWDTHMIGPSGTLIRDEAGHKGEMHVRHTPEQYRENLGKLVDAMHKTGARLVWASTTPIMSRTGKRFDDIKALNAVAEELMRDRGIAVDDLYAYTLPNAKEWQGGDKVHFNATGNEKLAKQVADSIRAALAKKGE